VLEAVPDRDSHESGDFTDWPGDDPFVLQVYEQVIGDRIVDVAAVADRLRQSEPRVLGALRTLVGLKLVKPQRGGGDGFVAVSPEAAESELVAPLEQGIHQRLRAVADIRGQLRTFSGTFNYAHRARRCQDTVQIVDDIDQIRMMLDDASRRCQSEVLTMQPGGGRAADQLRDALPRDREMLQRGVDMKIIYQHSARTDVPTRDYVREVSALGAQVRTSNEIFDRMIIFDRRIAFVPNHGSAAAAVVHEPTMVGVLHRFHQHVWLSASVLDPRDAAYGDTLDEVRATILELLASGLTDEVIARRIGLSARTCRRHIARLMSDLKADSRFQAGVAAALGGLVSLPG
jgi:sugar-specific transcriptional regulator TrmB